MKLLRLSIFAVFFCISIHAFAQADGPKAYWPVPEGTVIINPMYFNINSNQVLFENQYFGADADFTTNLYGIMGTYVFNLADRTAAVSGFLYAGESSGGTKQIQGKSSGLADFYGIGIINLIGGPSVSAEEYAKTEYDFAVDLQLAFKAPIGEYDVNKNINLGTNRWELKMGFPIMKFFNWGTAQATSIELLPSVSVYTHNNNITNGNRLKQKSTFNLESHITQQLFCKMLWASLDGYYIAGGATAIDDENYNNSIKTFQLGGTFGAYFSKQLGIKLSYGGVVAHNPTGMTGNMFRASVSYMF